MFQFAWTNWLTDWLNQPLICSPVTAPPLLSESPVIASLFTSQPLNSPRQTKSNTLILFLALFSLRDTQTACNYQRFTFLMAAVNCAHLEAISSPRGGEIKKNEESASRVRCLNESGVSEWRRCNGSWKSWFHSASTREADSDSSPKICISNLHFKRKQSL